MSWYPKHNSNGKPIKSKAISCMINFEIPARIKEIKIIKKPNEKIKNTLENYLIPKHYPYLPVVSTICANIPIREEREVLAKIYESILAQIGTNKASTFLELDLSKLADPQKRFIITSFNLLNKYSVDGLEKSLVEYDCLDNGTKIVLKFNKTSTKGLRSIIDKLNFINNFWCFKDLDSKILIKKFYEKYNLSYDSDYANALFRIVYNNEFITNNSYYQRKIINEFKLATLEIDSYIKILRKKIVQKDDKLLLEKKIEELKRKNQELKDFIGEIENYIKERNLRKN
ncbi:MAG: hypothetical protein V1824_02645 [archaeon]